MHNSFNGTRHMTFKALMVMDGSGTALKTFHSNRKRSSESKRRHMNMIQNSMTEREWPICRSGLKAVCMIDVKKTVVYLQK